MNKQGTGILLILLGFIALWLYTTGRFQALLNAWFSPNGSPATPAANGAGKTASAGGINPIMTAVSGILDPSKVISDAIGSIFGGIFG